MDERLPTSADSQRNKCKAWRKLDCQHFSEISSLTFTVSWHTTTNCTRVTDPSPQKKAAPHRERSICKTVDTPTKWLRRLVPCSSTSAVPWFKWAAPLATQIETKLCRFAFPWNSFIPPHMKLILSSKPESKTFLKVSVQLSVFL